MHAVIQSAPQRADAPRAPAPIDERDADIVIIGGGPGGGTAGALLAQKGWRVLLLEKDRHPRFHIGESLIPLNLPLFEQLGCAPAVKKVGLVKNSVQFHSMKHEARQTFAFADAWEGVPKYAYHVLDATGRDTDPASGARLNRAFERRVRRGLKTFTWMIYRMTSPIMRNLIMHPRDIFGVQRAVISFLAGDVYDSGPVRRRVMMFRGIYYLSAIKHWRQAWRSVVNRNNAIRPQAICATDGSG